jgi:purine nucleoside permease
MTAAQSLNPERGEVSYFDYFPSIEAAYTLGSVVVNKIIAGWNRYQTSVQEA